jgi:hypothetical protein
MADVSKIGHYGLHSLEILSKVKGIGGKAVRDCNSGIYLATNPLSTPSNSLFLQHFKKTIMKRVLMSTLFVLSAFMSMAQTVDDVINSYVTALGGKEKLASIQTLYMEAVSVMQNGNEVTSKIWKVNDKLVRREINFGMGSMTSVITDKEGWNSNPRNDNKFEPMTPEAVQMQQPELDCEGPLVDYKAKGHTAELQGTEDVEGAKCYKVKLTLKSGREITYLIDSKTYYITRMKTKGGGMGGPRGGDPNAELVIDYSDYRKNAEGYVFPYATTRVGMGGSTNIEKIEVNKPVDPKLYKPE